MMSKKMMVIMVFCSASLFAIFVYIVQSMMVPRMDNFSCRGKIEFIMGEESYLSQFMYNFHSGKGELSSLGELRRQGSLINNYSYHVEFSYLITKDRIYMKSSKPLLPATDENAAPALPDNNQGVNFIILPQGNRDYLFTRNGFPAFICTRI